MGTDLQLYEGAPRKTLRPASKGSRTRGRRESQPRYRLAASRVVLFDESAAEFLQFHQDLVKALHPRDALEEFLVERIVTSAWRLRRIYRIESGLFTKARVSAYNGKLKRTRDIELVFLRLTSADDDLAKLARYEASLDRSLRQALQQLACRQRRRSGSYLSSIGGRFAARCPNTALHRN